MSFDDFVSAYQKSSQPMKDFIDLGKVGDFCMQILGGTEFEKLKGKLNVFIAKEIVSKTTTPDLIVELKSLGLNDDFIITHYPSIKKFIEDGQKIDSNTSNSIISEIAEAEASLNNLTNQSVSNSIPTNPQPVETTYTSTQAAILTERPKTTLENPGRWETDK